MGCVIGIDPGAKGAIAIVDFEAELCRFIDFSKDPLGIISRGVIEDINNIDNEVPVFCEKLWSYPNQSSLTTWAQASMYGQTLLVLRDHFNSFELIPPITWKSKLGLKGDSTMTSTQKKRLTLEAARLWWPWVEGINLAKHDGRADSLMLAYSGSKFL